MAKRTAAGTLALAVCLGGGALALAGAANADSTFKFTTISGSNRAETAIAAAKAEFKTADTVILVNQANNHLVDGLTASYISGVKQAPILYTGVDSASDDTYAAIKAMGATHIILMGDDTAISDAQASAWTSSGFTVTREGGDNRYETAQKVAADFGGKASYAFVANGDNTKLADALAVGPAAYKAHFPILLTKGGDTPADGVQSSLSALGASPVVVGGSITDAQAATLGAKSGNVMNDGADRADTAATVATWSMANAGVNTTAVSLVSGDKSNSHLSDALVASPAGSPILFSGAVETTAYLQHHASTLTGTSWVFGDTNAVSSDDIAAATAAAQTVVASTSYTVTGVSSAASGKFTYANTNTNSATTVSFASTDKFMIDGTWASNGAFAAALAVGDQVSWSKDSSGVTTWSLDDTARTAGFTSGMIGDANTTAHTFEIVEPVTGVGLTSAINYTSSYTFYTIDGKQATQAQFELDINDGDSIAITGGDGTTAAKARTIALTNKTVTGKVAVAPTSAGVLSIKSTAGAIVGDSLSTGAGGASFTLGSSDAITLDGTTMASTDFTSTNIKAGYTVTYARQGGVQTVVVATAAPAPISGTVASGATTSSLTYWLGGDAIAETGIDVSSYVLSVNGTLVSPTEFGAALSAGGQVVIQKPGGTVTGSASLTTGPLSGSVTGVSNTSLTVATADGLGSLASVDYTNPASVFSDDTSSLWKVNGTSVTQQQFASEVSFVANGTKTASLSVSDSGSVSTYALTTATNTASATVTAVATPVSSTSVVVTFSKPVYFSSTIASSDFTLSQFDASSGASGAWVPLTVTSVSPSVAANASQTVVFTVTGGATIGAGDKFKVIVNSSGAAKMLDANGTAATATATAGLTSGAA